MRKWSDSAVNLVTQGPPAFLGTSDPRMDGITGTYRQRERSGGETNQDRATLVAKTQGQSNPGQLEGSSNLGVTRRRGVGPRSCLRHGEETFVMTVFKVIQRVLNGKVTVKLRPV